MRFDTRNSDNSGNADAVAISGTASLTTAGQASQLTATAMLSDSTTQNVTSSATWLSSNTGVATVSSAGLLTAVAAGTTTITATSQSKSGTLAVTVSIASATTTYQGTLIGGARSGSFTAIIQTAISGSVIRRSIGVQTTASASATLTLFGAGGTFQLTGTFDTSTSVLNLSGGGFVLTGTVGQGAISRTYTGPNNSREFAGLDATQNSITLYEDGASVLTITRDFVVCDYEITGELRGSRTFSIAFARSPSHGEGFGGVERGSVASAEGPFAAVAGTQCQLSFTKLATEQQPPDTFKVRFRISTSNACGTGSETGANGFAG